MLERQGTYQTLWWESEMGFSSEMYCFSVLHFSSLNEWFPKGTYLIQ